MYRAMGSRNGLQADLSPIPKVFPVYADVPKSEGLKKSDSHIFAVKDAHPQLSLPASLSSIATDYEISLLDSAPEVE